MFSRRTGTLYPADTSISDADLHFEADEYTLSDPSRGSVFKGARDTSFPNEVYWLYNEHSLRVGVLEDDVPLWFRDNVYSTLLQEDWAQDETMWSLLSQEAYEECREWTLDKIQSRTFLILLTPEKTLQYLGHILPPFTHCSRCGVCSNGIETPQELTPFNTLFLDADFVMYIPPQDSCVFSVAKIVPLQEFEFGGGI